MPGINLSENEFVSHREKLVIKKSTKTYFLLTIMYNIGVKTIHNIKSRTNHNAGSAGNSEFGIHHILPICVITSNDSPLNFNSATLNSIYKIFHDTYGISRVLTLFFSLSLYISTLKSCLLKNKYPEIPKKRGTADPNKTKEKKLTG